VRDVEVRRVARPWRIRHKLMLGLGLVASVMALVLAGTLFGLLSYLDTMKIMESKLIELNQANAFNQDVKQLTALLNEVGPADQNGKLRVIAQKARGELDTYKLCLAETVKHNRDTDGGETESGHVTALEENFAALEKTLNSPPEATSNGQASAAEQKARHDLAASFQSNSDDLREDIQKEIFDRKDVAKGHDKLSMIVVCSTSVFGVILLSGLLLYFYGWVFYPVRDLQAGAGRVAQGDFDHRIVVRSGDEMEDLAAAFNNMTERLRDIYRDLNRQVNERSRQLVRSERLASVGFLAAGVAHEINNPLQAITLYSGAMESRLADLLRRQGPPDDKAKAEHETITRYLKTILEEAFRCKRITERLLEVSRGGEGQRDPVDLTELVNSVIQVALPLQSCQGKTIDFDPPGKVVAWVNSDEIKSVALNLIVNALDSMEEGGKLTIRLAAQPAPAEGGGPAAVLEFSDTGCGMTPDVLENIFEPFYTRSKTGKGTGLGLTISHRIVTQHGGALSADSAGPDQGSTFTVRLPTQPPEQGATAPREQRTGPESREWAALLGARNAA
jgi:signal transduction histidine kinase